MKYSEDYQVLITLRTRLAFCVFLGLPLFLFTVGASKAADIVKVTRDGRETTLSQKLITVKANTPVWQDAAGSGKAEYVGAFNIFFHAKSDDGKIESLGKYRIADEKGKPLGWVKVEDVQPWGTRFAITPNVPNGQNKFEVQLDAGGQAIYDPEDIPSTAAAYSFITGPSKGTGSNAEDDGPFPVCFCIAESGSSGAAAEANQIANMELEIVFVLENADFLMSEYDEEELIEKVKDLATTFAELAKDSSKGEAVATRFGLVTYQDTNSAARDKRPVLVQPLTADVDGWMTKVHELKPSAIGADWPEDGISGIDLALSKKLGWKQNSSKHVVLIGKGAFQTQGRKQGGRPFRHYMAWYDDRSYSGFQEKWDDFFGFNSSGRTIRDLHEFAFPRGGATGMNLRQTYHLHAMRIGETTEQRLVRALGREEYADLMGAKDELAKTASTLSEADIVEAWLNSESIKKTLDFIWSLEKSAYYDDLALSHYRELATQGDVSGYFSAVQPNESDVRNAVNELRDKVQEAIGVIGKVASGEMDSVKAESQSSSGSEFSKPIFRIVNSSMKDGEIIEKPVQTGVAVVRSEATGRLVGNKVIMVSQNELTRLASAFNSLYEQFDRRRSRAERQDVSGVLDELKTSLAVASAGQKIDSGTQLSQLITDLPLRTTALSMTANDIAVMGTQDFEAWLEEIKLAEQRTRLLLNDDAGRWISISSLGNAKDRYAFPKVADLP